MIEAIKEKRPYEIENFKFLKEELEFNDLTYSSYEGQRFRKV